MEKQRDTILNQISTIESVPASALQAFRLLRDPNANMGEIVQIIGYDPGLTTNILKLANSSYFGSSREISSLQDAIIRLGTKNIFDLVVTALANVTLNKKVRGYNMSSGELWEHSIAVAVTCENIAAVTQSEDSKLAFTIGLLHDIGKILLGKFLEKGVMQEINQLLLRNITFDQAEYQILGIDHGELGGYLLEEWQLPDDLVDNVRNQYTPAKAKDPKMASILHVANILCISQDIGTIQRPVNTTISKQCFQDLNMTIEMRDEIVMRTKDSLENIRDIFSIQT
jgi:putative nucleotidyltransferase with HDIG domain